MLATGTDDRVLALGTRQAKHGTALRTFAVDVCLSVAEFVFAKTEEAAKAFVFPTALDDVAREHSVKDQNKQRDRQKVVAKRERKLRAQRLGRNEERADKVRNHNEEIHAEQDVV